MDVVQAWFSSEGGKRYTLTPQPDLPLIAPQASQLPTIHVDPGVRYQPILGIGCSFEEATIYNLQRMPDGERVLRSLVDPVDGIGSNLMRICFGSSDFTARPYYSHDDVPPGETDPDLQHFAIAKDVEYGIVDLVRRAMAINPELRIFASPWSPPAWMKSGGTMCGGRLLREYYPVAARYYRMAVEACAAPIAGPAAR
jgi:glucosylceramidase